MGIDWWEHDPFLTTSARGREGEVEDGQRSSLTERLDRIEAAVEALGRGKGR